MKFARYLKDHAIDEWRKAYINYRLLKKQIGKAEAELDAQDEEGEAEHDLIRRATSTSWKATATVNRDLERGTGGGELDAGTAGGGASLAPVLTASPFASDLSLTSMGGDSDGTRNTDAPLVKRRPSQASGINTSGGLLKKLQVKRENTFLTKGGDFNPKKWRSGYPANVPLAQLYEILPPASRKFFTVLDRELDRVSSFYADREEDAIKRFELLSLQWKELADHKKEFQAFRARELNPPPILAPIISRVPQLPGANLVRRTLAQRAPRTNGVSTPAHARDPNTASCFAHRRPEEYTVARSKLKLATFEYYRSLGMLKSYRVLNRTGFVKALKKYEKTTKIPCATSYTPKVDKANFVASTNLDELIRETEDAFASVFEHGDRKKALERLREFGQRKMHHFTAWRAGMYMGIAIPLLVEGIVKSTQESTRLSIPYWEPLLQLFSAMYLPVLFAMLFYLNLVAWASARINYVLIFELDVRTRLDIHQFIEIPALLFCILSLFFWAAFSDFWPNHIAPSAYPLAFLVAALALLLMPYRVLYPSARWWMVRSFFRVLTAGLIRVEFRDFFLGDELNSLSYAVVNLGLLFCAYNHRWPDDVGQICSTNSTWATPILASLPAAWRLGQSIRRYLDSDGLMIHMLNAGKYTASIFQFFFYYSWRIYGSSSAWRKGIWITAAIINSIYTATWDIVMDWSLFRKNSKNFLLRSELGFFKDQSWMYYVAIVLDMVLRFAWIWIVWNGFRVESEHIGNVDGYRVTRNVPLPYTTNVSPESPDGEDDLDPTPTRRQAFFTFVNNLHRGLIKDFAPLSNIRLPSLGGATTALGSPDRGRGRGRRSKDAGSTRRKSQGTATESSTDDDEDEDGDDDEESDEEGNAIDEVEEEVEDADRMMAKGEEGRLATKGMDLAEFALSPEARRDE